MHSLIYCSHYHHIPRYLHKNATYLQITELLKTTKTQKKNFYENQENSQIDNYGIFED